MMTSLQKGIEAAKTGSMDDALAHLKDAIIEEPENANVWVWLSAIIEDEDKQTIFLKKALEIDPDNRPAQRGLAYIERKKVVPPKPGEKLSDYTKPIGLFRTSPPDTKAPMPSLQPEGEPARMPETESKVKQPPKDKPSSITPQTQPSKNEKNTAWLDIVLYIIIFMVFVIIGVLVGSTFLKIDLPFLNTPTPAIQALPPQEGIYLFIDGAYQEMKTNLGEPEFEEGIPSTTESLPSIVVDTPLVDIETLLIKYEDGSTISFQTKKLDDTLYLVNPNKALAPGMYCLIHTLNAEKGEALYWCFRIK